MKNIYILYTIKKEDKFFSGVIKTTNGSNLVSTFAGISHLKTANIYPRNKAYEIADAWNESYKNNGTLLTY